jgi:hypothetical protein
MNNKVMIVSGTFWICFWLAMIALAMPKMISVESSLDKIDANLDRIANALEDSNNEEGTFMYGQQEFPTLHDLRQTAETSVQQRER